MCYTCVIARCVRINHTSPCIQWMLDESCERSSSEDSKVYAEKRKYTKISNFYINKDVGGVPTEIHVARVHRRGLRAGDVVIIAT